MLLLSFRISKSDKTWKSKKQKIPHKTGIAPPPKKKIENVSPVHVNIDPRSRPTFPIIKLCNNKSGEKKRKCSHRIIIVTLRCYY